MHNSTPTSSRDDLLRLRNEGKITEEQYQQLLEAISKPPSNPPPPQAEPAACPLKCDINALRMRILAAVLVGCIITLPVGIVMRLPYVWGLAIAGIIIAPVAMYRIAKSREKCA